MWMCEFTNTVLGIIDRAPLAVLLPPSPPFIASSPSRYPSILSPFSSVILGLTAGTAPYTIAVGSSGQLEPCCATTLGIPVS